MNILSAASVFPVSDLEASLRFFIDVLGFREDFRFGPYAGIKRDNCRLHLSAHRNPDIGGPGSAAVYIICDEVDGYFANISERGAVCDGAPEDCDYGMRDFIVHDPDGNQLTFGTAMTGA